MGIARAPAGALAVRWPGGERRASSTAAGCRLRRHWDDGERVEILAVVSAFGLLNRWQDSMATNLEETPRAFATRTIGAAGSEPRTHEPGSHPPSE